tara:strand:- start:5483 stop:6139 length:657 start_codon:yes stop_codon:yes gene_type:complete
MKSKNNNFFWVGYADLMTSLFFIMLVLFVVMFSAMKNEQNKLQLKLEEFNKIEEIKRAVNNLDPKYFKYDEVNKRHELAVDVIFRSGNYDIPEESKANLVSAGLELQNIINNIPKEQNIRYLVIIEGMAARYTNATELWRNSDPKQIEDTYLLSYNRAKSLYKFWKDRGINFDESIFEIVLAGSGWFGAGRYVDENEGKNKRFLIQILPKVGLIQEAN